MQWIRSKADAVQENPVWMEKPAGPGGTMGGRKDMENEIEKLQRIIDESDNIVFFGGAGVSTESGIPDFRSQDGLYNQKYDYPPETILSHTFFMRRPEEFLSFIRIRCSVIQQSQMLRI